MCQIFFLCGGQKRIQDLLELELPAVVIFLTVRAENRLQALWIARCGLNHISPAPAC